jgi:hypothetical protein
MGAETQNQRLAGGAESRARLKESLEARRRGERPVGEEGIRRRREMFARQEEEGGPAGPEGLAEAFRQRKEQEMRPQVGEASMFPDEAPGVIGSDVPKPPGYEEASYRRGEVTRERDRTGRREEIFRQFQQAAGEGTAEVTPGGAVERGAGIFGRAFGGAGEGGRAGIMFGPGRANRMPDAGSPEYQQLVERMRRRRG